MQQPICRFPTDLASLIAASIAGQSFEFRPFWSHRARADARISDACFSQWWPATFVVAGTVYSSAEHYMMAEKARLFGDEFALGQILGSVDPAELKRLGRTVRGFDEAVWGRARFGIVTAANIHKFGQNVALRSYLIATANAVLVEASPTDRVWGIGLAASDPEAADPTRWRGENLLGFALMRARDELLAETSSPQPIPSVEPGR